MQKLNDALTLAIARVMTLSRDDLKRQDGQGATEYALVVGFIVVAVAATVGVLGTSITGLLGRVAAAIDGLF